MKKYYKEFKEEWNIPTYHKRKEGRKEGRLTGFVASCVGSAFYNMLL
jgi:hypothetical protein